MKLAVLEQLSADTAKIVADHESRVRKLERWLYMGMGIVGVGGFLLHIAEVFMKGATK